MTPTAASHADRPLKDPVCGMTVTEKSPHYLTHQGVTLYFCCAGCKNKFAANPEKYSSPSVTQPIVPGREPTGSEAEGTIYTCPMHLEVRQVGPGICPKCGLMLEPELPSLDEGENPELINFSSG
jgi:Cu+-exporting ATPase